MELSEISSALQRGEALTDEQKARAICALRNWTLSSVVTGGFWFSYIPGDTIVHDYEYSNKGDPFVSIAAALTFVAEAFPGFQRHLRWGGCDSGGGDIWLARIGLAQGRACKPAAAIMAAAIEAHLRKGGE